MRKLTVLCDLDGIIVDLLGPWLRCYNSMYNDNLTPERITDWDIHQFTKPECGTKVYNFIDDGEVYRNLHALDGAIEGVHAIEADGHEVIVVSAGSKNLATAGHKLEWCREYLGFKRQKCIIAHKKELISGDVFIDDAPPNIRKYKAKWPNTPILTIAYPYNQQVASLCTRYEDYKHPRFAWGSMVEGIKWLARNS